MEQRSRWILHDGDFDDEKRMFSTIISQDTFSVLFFLIAVVIAVVVVIVVVVIILVNLDWRWAIVCVTRFCRLFLHLCSSSYTLAFPFFLLFLYRVFQRARLLSLSLIETSREEKRKNFLEPMERKRERERDSQSEIKKNSAIQLIIANRVGEREEKEKGKRRRKMHFNGKWVRTRIVLLLI